jgi:hypothetical protein
MAGAGAPGRDSLRRQPGAVRPHHLTYTEAALRARRVALAGALVAERTRRKPSSPFNRLLLQRVRMALPAWA